MIRINKVDALININSSPARMSIQQPKADFEMRQKLPKVQIHTEHVKVNIDQRDCFNESGLMDDKTLIKDGAERGRQAAFEAIGRIASEGDMLAAIENKTNAIAEISFSNSWDQEKYYDIAPMPASRPKIDFTGGTVDIKVDEGTVSIDTRPNKPIIDVELGGVEISLKQKPEISFEYIGENVDKKV